MKGSLGGVRPLCKPRASLCHPELVLCRDSPCLSQIHILDHMFMRATEGLLVSVARNFQSNFPTLSLAWLLE